MPVVLVMIIAVAWVVALGPSLLKRRAHGGAGISSISHFHHQLRVLEHSGPTPIVAPAYRLHAVDGAGGRRSVPYYPEANTAPVLTVVGAKQLPRPALAFLGEHPVDPSVDRASTGSPSTGSGVVTAGAIDDWILGPGRRDGEAATRLHDSHARQLARRRRRDTLGILALVFSLSLLIGFVPGAAFVWAVTALSGLGLLAYVALLVQMRRLAEERERKLHYLNPPSTEGSDPDRSARLPGYISGRYAHPSNGAAAAY